MTRWRFVIPLLALCMIPSAAARSVDSIPRRDLEHDHRAAAWFPDGSGVLFLRHYVSPKGSVETLHLGFVSRSGRVSPPLASLVYEGCTHEGSERITLSGTRIVFAAPEFDGAEDCDLYIVNQDGSGLRNLTQTPFRARSAEFGPRWSPDGRLLAYEQKEEPPNAELASDSQIVVLGVDRGTTHVVALGRGVFWSPDSRRLLLTRGPLRSSAIISVTSDGSEVRQLTPPSGWVASGWSADGRRILGVYRPDSSKASIWTMNADGTSKRKLASGRSPTWSPRGRLIAFTRGTPEEPRFLFVMRDDGGPVRSVSRLAGQGKAASYSWAPDARTLAVTRADSCLYSGVFLVGLRGTTRNLTNDCRIIGGAGHDRLRGTRERDLVWGLAGNDVVDTNPGDLTQRRWTHGDADVVWAGAGNDRVQTSLSPDRLYGGPGKDRLAGESEADHLFGGAGNDFLHGGASNDWLVGGPGSDRLVGGPGVDRILARDGAQDILVCGRGRDRAVVDRSDRVAPDCEIVSAS